MCGSPEGPLYLFGPPTNTLGQWQYLGCWDGGNDGPTFLDYWHFGSGPKTERLAGVSNFRYVWCTTRNRLLKPEENEIYTQPSWLGYIEQHRPDLDGQTYEQHAAAIQAQFKIPGLYSVAPPLAAASPASWFDPNATLPGQASAPFAPPVAFWRRPDSEWEQGRKTGYAVASGQRAGVDTHFVVETWTIDGHGPIPPKEITVEKFPDRALPPVRTKEIKTKFVAAGPARRILDFIGESVDLVEALWKALPKECRKAKGKKRPWPYKSDKPKPQDMLRDLYACWDHLDSHYVNRAVGEFFANQIEDLFWGTIGKVSGKAGSRIGRAVGIQTGPIL